MGGQSDRVSGVNTILNLLLKTTVGGRLDSISKTLHIGTREMLKSLVLGTSMSTIP